MVQTIYYIIKAHGGEIKVKTKEGEGTQFIIQLPLISPTCLPAGSQVGLIKGLHRLGILVVS